jgi:bifunctional non-homologous end joining protein LigD
MAMQPRSNHKGPKAGPAPAEFLAPMKALGCSELPIGTWHCEIKYDGYRAVAVVNNGDAELWSRNRKPMGADYPGVLTHLRRLRCHSAVLDGELVALDPQGRSRFQLLQNRVNAGTGPTVVYYVFDLLHRDGRDLTGLAIEKRRRALVRLLGEGGPAVRVTPVFDVEPAKLFAQARRHGLEGIVAKRPGSSYEPGGRSGAWLKCKVVAEQEFVIGGFSAPQNSREHFGAILVGYFANDSLRYAGKVGTGFDRSQLAALHARLLAKRTPTCPFHDLPSARRSRYGAGMGPAEMGRATWVKPVLVAQVKFAEWTSDGLLRQPVFLGLREDKKASAVRREKAAIGHRR